MGLYLDFFNLRIVLLPVGFIVVLCFRLTSILLLLGIHLRVFGFLFLRLFFLLFFLRRGRQVRTNRCDSSRLLFPQIIRPFLHLYIKVGVLTWRCLRVNHSEVIFRKFFFNLTWVETHSVAVFLCRYALKNILLHLLSHFILHLPLDFLALFNWQLDNLKTVMYQLIFHNVVCLSVGVKAWCVVHFQHPWLQFLVQHDVKAKQLKAAVWFFALAWPIDVRQVRLHCNYCFDHYSVDIGPDILCRSWSSGLSFLYGRLGHLALQAISKF